MDLKTYTVLGSTFLMGVFVGAYLYITVFVPNYSQVRFDGDETQIDFLLRGAQRGECNRGDSVCPSFELRSDRTYTYIATYVKNGRQEVVEGRLGKDRFDSLLTYIAAVDLRALEKRSFGACSRIYDTNYMYNLVYNGESYIFDTCNTVFKDSVLATQFYPLWTRLATTTPTSPLLEEGLNEILREWLYNQFHATSEKTGG